MLPPRPSAARPPLPAGFSLMEVTIALAIVAIACIPLIGMLPAGLKTMRDGRREVIEAEITRLLTNELSMSSWKETNNLEDFENHDRYFDVDGVPLDDERRAAFTARIVVGEGTTLPGAPEPNAFLKQVEIRVTDKPAGLERRFTDPDFHRVHSVLIAKMDK